MGTLARKLIETGIKASRKVVDVDYANPITQDTLNFAVKIVKEILF
jgi:hypothetical protein